MLPRARARDARLKSKQPPETGKHSLKMSQKYNDYLKTDYWKAVADAVKKRAGYKCQLCNSPHDIEAHHRSYAHLGRELDFLDDLTCLCRKCHGRFHEKPIPPPAPAVIIVKEGGSVRITAENFRCLKYNRETWQWMKRAGIKPKKSGWNRRAIGQLVPERFLY
jgi:hypothetical protein